MKKLFFYMLKIFNLQVFCHICKLSNKIIRTFFTHYKLCQMTYCVQHTWSVMCIVFADMWSDSTGTGPPDSDSGEEFLRLPEKLGPDALPVVCKVIIHFVCMCYVRGLLWSDSNSIILFCMLRMYCNVLVGSISRWNFIALKVQYTTVNYSQQLF
jgi:hypothetical protein